MQFDESGRKNKTYYVNLKENGLATLDAGDPFETSYSERIILSNSVAGTNCDDLSLNHWTIIGITSSLFSVSGKYRRMASKRRIWFSGSKLSI